MHMHKSLVLPSLNKLTSKTGFAYMTATGLPVLPSSEIASRCPTAGGSLRYALSKILTVKAKVVPVQFGQQFAAECIRADTRSLYFSVGDGERVEHSTPFLKGLRLALAFPAGVSTVALEWQWSPCWPEQGRPHRDQEAFQTQAVWRLFR